MAAMDVVGGLQEADGRAQCEALPQVSKRHCIELVNKIRELGLLEVHNTLDGKEYVTPKRLKDEVEAGLQAKDGRISITELQTVVNVDTHHIESAVQKVVQEAHGDKHLVQGELMTNAYLDRVARDADVVLQEKGFIKISDTAHHANLPLEFMYTVIESRLGTIVQGQQEAGSRGALYTPAFMEHQTAHVQEVFSAITEPTSVSAIMLEHHIQENGFQSVLNELIRGNRLSGVVKRGVYVPTAYTRARLQRAAAFFEQNDCIDYEQLKRLGIEDCKSFCKGRDGEELPHVFAGRALVDRIAQILEESLTGEGYCDVKPFLPPQFTEADTTALLWRLPVIKNDQTIRIVGGSLVITHRFLDDCLKVFDGELRSRAAKYMTSGGRKAAAAKPERKRGSVAGDEDHAADAFPEPFSTTEVVGILKEKASASLDLADDSSWVAVAEALRKPLLDKFKECTQNVFSSAHAERRGLRADVEVAINDLLLAVTMFLKGIQKMPGDTKSLRKHLLRTTGTDLLRVLYHAEALDVYSEVSPEQLSTRESRQALAQGFHAKSRQAMATLEEAAAGHDVDSFLRNVTDTVAVLEIAVKKVDKKAERAFIADHLNRLQKDLRSTNQPAAALHLVALVLFQTHTDCPLRSVPQVIAALHEYVNPSTHKLLLTYQQLILDSVSKEPEHVARAQEIATEMKTMLQAVKDIGTGKQSDEAA